MSSYKLYFGLINPAAIALTDLLRSFLFSSWAC